MPVIAQGLPETQALPFLDPKAHDPLRTLPEIQMRHNEPGGRAVFGFHGRVVGLDGSLISRPSVWQSGAHYELERRPRVRQIKQGLRADYRSARNRSQATLAGLRRSASPTLYS